MKVGVFDSGIGGLTILKALIEKHPNNEYIYFGDTLNLPYGNKTYDELLSFSKKIIDFLIKEKVEAIVVACGTLSSTVMPELKKTYDIPLFDIITPVVESIQKTNIKTCLLLGTEATINTRRFQHKLENANLEVFPVSCPEFVPIIEGKSDTPLNAAIGEYLFDYKEKKIDCIIPGCTHYIIISEELSEYVGATCLDLASIIASKINFEYGIAGIDIYFSKVTPELLNNVTTILGNVEMKEISI